MNDLALAKLDSQLIAISGGSDARVKVWSVASSELLYCFTGARCPYRFSAIPCKASVCQLPEAWQQHYVVLLIGDLMGHDELPGMTPCLYDERCALRNLLHSPHAHVTDSITWHDFLAGHEGPVYSVCPHMKGNISFVFSTGRDGRIKAWLYDSAVAAVVDYSAEGGGYLLLRCGSFQLMAKAASCKSPYPGGSDEPWGRRRMIQHGFLLLQASGGRTWLTAPTAGASFPAAWAALALTAPLWSGTSLMALSGMPLHLILVHTITCHVPCLCM